MGWKVIVKNEISFFALFGVHDILNNHREENNQVWVLLCIKVPIFTLSNFFVKSFGTNSK